MPRFHPSIRLALALLLLALGAAASAQETACRSGNRPAATLLIPYFEVDLEDPLGVTTLFAVANASPEPVIAHAVVWTDWGIPTLAWDIYLGGDEVRTYNLRSLFEEGTLPPSGEGQSFGTCSLPTGLAPLDPAALTTLLQQHTGQEVEPGESCFSKPREDDSFATGYVTVDVARDCAGEARFPGDHGYFGPEGLAGTENVLWGDFFYVTSGEDFAQGEAAVAVRAEPGRFAPGDATFYGRFVGRDASDGRAPLATTYRTRFLEGGPFDGGTELILWIDSGGPSRPLDCSVAIGLSSCRFVLLATFDEAGLEQGDPDAFDPGQTISRRLEVGGADLPVEIPFGFVEVANRELPACNLLPASLESYQAWVAPLLSARGRFSVGLPGTPVDPACTPAE